MFYLSKKFPITLYVQNYDYFCIFIKIIIQEKNLFVTIVDTNKLEKKNELNRLNPYKTVPTLVTRDLILYRTNIIAEYIEERFPYPSLLPISPLEKTRERTICNKILKKILPLFDKPIDDKREELSIGDCHLLHFFKESLFLREGIFTILDIALALLCYKIIIKKILLKKCSNFIIIYTKKIFKKSSILKILNL